MTEYIVLVRDHCQPHAGMSCLSEMINLSHPSKPDQDSLPAPSPPSPIKYLLPYTHTHTVASIFQSHSSPKKPLAD